MLEFIHVLSEHYSSKLLSVCLFGSTARGDSGPQSDLDFLAVVEDLPLDRGLRCRAAADIIQKLRETPAYDIHRKSGRRSLIQVIQFTPNEIDSHPPILLDIVEDGIILVDANAFLFDALEELRQKLRQVGAHRVPAKRGYYWILKPGLKAGEILEI